MRAVLFALVLTVISQIGQMAHAGTFVGWDDKECAEFTDRGTRLRRLSINVCREELGTRIMWSEERCVEQNDQGTTIGYVADKYCREEGEFPSANRNDLWGQLTN